MKIAIRYVSAFVLSMLAVQPIVAQKTNKTDSLLQVLSRYEAVHKNRQPDLRDSVKANILNELALALLVIDENPTHYAHLQFDLSKKIRYNRGVAQAYNIFGLIHDYKDDMPSAIKYYQAALKTGHRSVTDEAATYTNIGNAYLHLSNYNDAIKNMLHGLELSKQSNNKYQIARANNNMGVLYKMKGDYPEALKYFFNVFKIVGTDGDPQLMAMAYMNIGNVYGLQEKSEQAIIYLSKSLKIAQEANQAEPMAMNYNAIGMAYSDKGDFTKANENFEAALKINTETGNKRGMAKNYITMGRNFLMKGDMQMAIGSAKKGMPLAIAVPDIDLQDNAFEVLIKSYKTLGDFKQAFEHQEMLNRLRDSISSVQRSETISKLKLEYDVKSAQDSLLVIQTKKDAKALVTAKREKMKNYSALAALLVVSGIAFWFNRNLRRNQKQKRLIEDQNKVIRQSLTEKETLLREIHHRVKNNLQIISSLLNIQSEDIQDANVLSSIQEGQSRVEAMSLIHQNLYQSEHLNNVDIENYMKGLVQYLSKMFRGESESVTVNIETSNLRFDIDTAIPLGLIVNELVSNAYKYAFDANEKGQINISIRAKSDTDYELNITNDGKPLPADFDPKQSKSLGLKLVSILSRQLRGRLSSYSDNGMTSFTVDFKDLKAWHASN